MDVQERRQIISSMLITICSTFYVCFFTYPVLTWLMSQDQMDEDLINLLIRRLRRRIMLRRNPIRITNFVERTVGSFNTVEFQSHFRLSVDAFDSLLNMVGDQLKSAVGRHVINPRKQLLAVLWLLATPDSYRSIGLRFDMGKSSLFHSFIRVIEALNMVAPIVIKWPHGEYRQKVVHGFSRMAGLEQVLGAVDGTYIPIKAPTENPEVYINRKCFYGITLQAVCDDQRKFTDCFVGYPSSVSDIRIFKNSPIYREINSNQQHYFEEGQFIIGDKAYPVRSWCLPPFIDRGLLGHEKHFNTVHAKTRQIIERAFALLFGRFRRLRYLDMNRVDLIPSTVIAACVLHNICLEKSDHLQNQFEEEGTEFVVGGQGDVTEVNRNNIDGGYNARSNLARKLYELLRR